MTMDIRTVFLTAVVLAAAPQVPAPVAMVKSSDRVLSALDRPDGQDNTDTEDKVEPPPAEAQPSRKANTARVGAETDEALRCLALNIYHEARSEPETGQRAVAAVTINRVRSKTFPSSVCKVVKQGGQRRNRCQFSWWCDGKKDQPMEAAAWQQALAIGRLSLRGEADDPTNGALYYHADYVRPRWSRTFERTARIGSHLFYKPVDSEPVHLAAAD
jgi:spore germination cell wall hydrolase CwlJ-like protein